MRFQVIAASVLAACAAAGCGDGGQRTAVPLPQAYPRIETYASRYRVADSLPVAVEVNAGAAVTCKEGGMPALDIAYPRYNATVYLTVVPGLADKAKFEDVWEGRRSRIDNNLGGAQAVAEEIISQADSSYRSALVVSPSATQTPVQLLAASRARGTVVTATAFMHTPVTSANLDSVAPVIKALAADLHHIALTLK